MKYVASIFLLALLSGCATNASSKHSQEQTKQQQQQQAEQSTTTEVSVQSEPVPHESHYLGYHRDLNSFWGFWGPWNGGFYFPAYYGGYVGSLHPELRGDYSHDDHVPVD